MRETMLLKISGRQSGLLAAGGFDLEAFSWGFADKKDAYPLIMTDFRTELSMRGKG